MNTTDWKTLAEVELIYRTKVKASERPKIKQSKDAYELFKQHWDEGKMDFIEQMKILLLNRANAVLGIMDISSGSTTGTIADPKIILAAAIKSNAVGCILCHNHPSASLKPSRADEEHTARIAQAARLIDLRLLDHIIITSEGYFSFADEGLI